MILRSVMHACRYHIPFIESIVCFLLILVFMFVLIFIMFFFFVFFIFLLIIVYSLLCTLHHLLVQLESTPLRAKPRNPPKWFYSMRRVPVLRPISTTKTSFPVIWLECKGWCTETFWRRTVRGGETCSARGTKMDPASDFTSTQPRHQSDPPTGNTQNICFSLLFPTLTHTQTLVPETWKTQLPDHWRASYCQLLTY